MLDVLNPSLNEINHAAIATYMLLNELHRLAADPGTPDNATLGIILGTAMFCDDKIGPFRAQSLFQQVPGIVLKTDARVTSELAEMFAPVLSAFRSHLDSCRQKEGGCIRSAGR